MIRLALCGDVMLGRGIDQILPHPGDPAIHETYAQSASFYVDLAERMNGAIPRPVDYDYVWGDALAALDDANSDARIVNLETSITSSDDFERKGINYRMHPRNVAVLASARIGCCALANNHVLDWGARGLEETLLSLERAEIVCAGAGRNVGEAASPAHLALPDGRELVLFAFGLASAGIPPRWAATASRAGVNFLPDLSRQTIDSIAQAVAAVRKDGDVLVASLHWGGNWGYAVSFAQRAFAHDLIDAAGFHLVHGHSSHHPKGAEIHNGRLILYGCGDFINDYEGIGGREEYRGDLAILYLAGLSESGALASLDMIPFQMRRFRLHRASPSDARWLQRALDRECRALGAAHVRLDPGDILSLGW